jgi:hypothetical protein
MPHVRKAKPCAVVQVATAMDSAKTACFRKRFDICKLFRRGPEDLESSKIREHQSYGPVLASLPTAIQTRRSLVDALKTSGKPMTIPQLSQLPIPRIGGKHKKKEKPRENNSMAISTIIS